MSTHVLTLSKKRWNNLFISRCFTTPLFAFSNDSLTLKSIIYSLVWLPLVRGLWCGCWPCVFVAKQWLQPFFFTKHKSVQCLCLFPSWSWNSSSSISNSSSSEPSLCSSDLEHLFTHNVRLNNSSVSTIQ